MSRSGKKNSDTPDTGLPASGSIGEVDWSDWEDRLSEARARRAVLIAEGESAGAAKTGKTATRHKRKDAPVAFVPRPPITEAVVSGASKLLVVFVAACGIGVGIILGLGMIAKDDDGTGSQVAAVPGDGPAVTNDLLETGKATFFDASPPSNPGASVPGPSFAVPQLDPPEQPAPDTVEIPSISPVAFAPDGPDAAEGKRRRSLPGLEGGADPDVAVRDADAVVPAEIFLHVPSGVPEGRILATISQIEASGAKIARIGRENFRVSATHLRYYSAQSAENATRLADLMGIEARDFSSTRVVPGRIELWVKGQPAARTEALPDVVGFLSRLVARVNTR